MMDLTPDGGGDADDFLCQLFSSFGLKSACQSTQVASPWDSDEDTLVDEEISKAFGSLRLLSSHSVFDMLVDAG